MALLRSALDRLTDSSVKATLNEEAYSQVVRPALREIRARNPYAVPLQAADALETLGIGTDPTACFPHTHAAAKAIETDLLHSAGCMLPKDRPVTLLFLKRSKIQTLRRSEKMCIMHNQIIEPRDFQRYDKDTLVDSYCRIETDYALMADTLHFLHPLDVLRIFKHSPELHTMVATMVLPPEAMHKHPSAWPDIYSLNYSFGGFQYLPGSHGGASYHHEFEQLQWLKAGWLIKDDLEVTIQMVESKGANHLFVLTRGHLLTPAVRSFHENDFVILPRIFLPPRTNVNAPIPKTFAMKMFMYTQSLKQVKMQDIWAKMRQLLPSTTLDRWDPIVLTHCANYFFFLGNASNLNSNSMSLNWPAWMKPLLDCKSSIEDFYHSLVGDSKFDQFLRALHWTPFTYSLEVERIEFLSSYKIASTRDQGKTKSTQKSNLYDLPPLDLGPGCLEEDCEGEEGMPSATPPPKPKEVPREQFKERTDAPQATQAHPVNNPKPDQPKNPHLFKVVPSDNGDWDFSWADPYVRVEECDVPTTQGSEHRPGKEPTADEEGDWDKVDFDEATKTAPSPNQPSAQTGTKSWFRGLFRKTEEPSTSEKPQGPDPEEAVQSELPWTLWNGVLKESGFDCSELQYDGEGNLIMPITDIVSGLPHAKTSNLIPKELIACFAKLKRRITPVTMQGMRAAAYASDIKNARVGALLKSQPLEWRSALSLKCEQGDRIVPGVIIHGCGGSGKSYCLQQFIHSFPRHHELITVVCPTTELMHDWANKCPRLDTRRIRTFEKAMLQGASAVVIFDDYGKTPAGFIEAYLRQHSNVELVILTGDNRQSVHHEGNQDASSAHLEPAVEYFQRYCSYYLNCTHRNPKRLANMLGVYSTNEAPIRITQSSKFQPGWATLVPSTVKQTSYRDMGVKTYTYTGCQGLTVDKVQIVLDNDTCACSSRAFYTALSRARSQIHFVNTGPNSAEYWTKLDQTPYLKTFLDLARAEAMPRESVEEAVVHEPVPKTHLPVENPACVLDGKKDELKDKHDREVYTKRHGSTNCVQTNDPVVQMFQHQQARDEALLDITMDKRIKTSTVELNEKEFYFKSDLGDVLFQNYKQAMGLPAQPVPFDEDLWQACRSEIQNVFMAKPAHMIANAAKRHDPDFAFQRIELFLKSQWKTKIDAIGENVVKPGQTIASFYQKTVMIFGTMARYLRRQRDAYQPKHILINCEITPDRLDQWILEHWSFGGKAFANDFKEFDQSQDGSMLQFEVMKAKYFNIPSSIIDAYIFVKTHAQIWVGILAIMRLTGEGPTFDANTECNIAFQHTKHHIPSGASQLYAGDDSAIDCVPVLKPSFEALSSKFSLKSKEKEFAQRPGDWAEFCGWLITPCGLIKDPYKLYATTELHCKLGHQEFARSFAQDCYRAFQKGDKLYEILTEEEMALHQNTARKLIKMGLRLKGLDDVLQPLQEASSQ
uniref:RNA replication protein n=1 Tax=Agave potexvirus 1 TaxID=2794411 RepID=A0A7T5QZ98_9VIRU|nr:RdRp [Agave potexvirus 1]